MPKRIVAIHQPNFFPWLGYFAKIAQADVFVFLDRVDYPKSGSSMASYSSRVQINVGGAAKWWGCPVVREAGRQAIGDVLIRKEPWTKKALRTLEQNYSKAPYFSQHIESIRDMVLLDEMKIGNYNAANVIRICELLGIQAEFVYQSDLETSGASTELLVDIVTKVGGDAYLSGKGAALQYQEEGLFEAAGIDLAFTTFAPRPYAQVKTTEFLPGLSILDAMLNLGLEGAGKLATGEAHG